MHAKSYLERIRYGGEIAPTVETLRRIHRAHMLAVPFENLDIHLGVPIALSVPAFYEKIVDRKRGGFCYELNGLFAWLLTELGYSVTLVSARVFAAGQLSPEFDHLVLLVACGERWIADVGFGDSTLEPLRLDDRTEGEYSILPAGGSFTLQRRRAGAWEPQYAFALAPRRLDEFTERCAFQQTSADSHFTQKTVCSLATETGRVTLSGRTLILTTGPHRAERVLDSAGEYRNILADTFGARLTEREADRLFGARTGAAPR